MNQNKLNQYQMNQVSTASPEQILLMLYDGAIRFTRQAIEGIVENKLEMKRHGISKTIAIVTEFSNTLDHKIGGKIADDLHELYDFMIRELIAANIGNDIEVCVCFLAFHDEVHYFFLRHERLSHKHFINVMFFYYLRQFVCLSKNFHTIQGMSGIKSVIDDSNKFESAFRVSNDLIDRFFAKIAGSYD